MTLDEIRLASHQIAMYKAHKSLPGTIGEWRKHNRAAAALRGKVGTIYQPYPFPNKDIAKALYLSLSAHEIDRPTFAACMASLTGKYRDDAPSS